MDLTQVQTYIRELAQTDWGLVGEKFRLWLLPYELRFSLFLLLLLLFVLVNIFLIIKIRRNKGVKDTHRRITIPKINKDVMVIKKGSFLSKHLLLVVNIFFIAILLFLGGTTFAMRPMVVYSSPLPESYMQSSHERIELIFDVPVDVDQLEFNISPDIEGEWVLEPISPIEPFKRKVYFYPKQSVPPDSEVVIYLVGIRQWWWAGKLHEQSIEFKSPRVPKVAEPSIKDKAVDVSIDTVIDLKYDAPIGEFVNIVFQIEPAVPFHLEETGENSHSVIFDQSLNQDETYAAKVLITPRSYNVKTKEDVELGETLEATSFSFTTVTTPFIESFTPEGSSVLPDSDIKIVFDQPMDRESVEEKFSIKPEVAGEITWDDDKTMTFKPKSPLTKETKYEVKLAVGIASSVSGRIDKEISQTFETIGKVKVLSVSPVSGTNGHNPKSTNIIVQFDQQVDKTSAQGSFIISPVVAGTFSWDGNKMVYSTAGKLAYSTKYSYTIKPGVKSIHGKDSDQTFSYNFTTKANSFSLAIPQYHQQEGFTCNVSAARMALAYRGIYVQEADVKNGVGIGTNPNEDWVPNYGVHAGPIAAYIGQYRQVAIKTGWNTPALAAEVEKGNPVILWWYNRFSQGGYFTFDNGVQGLNGMHSEVVEGFYGDSSNPTHIITNDPWRGHQVYSRSAFESTWSYLGNTAVVVY